MKEPNKDIITWREQIRSGKMMILANIYHDIYSFERLKGVMELIAPNSDKRFISKKHLYFFYQDSSKLWHSQETCPANLLWIDFADLLAESEPSEPYKETKGSVNNEDSRPSTRQGRYSVSLTYTGTKDSLLRVMITDARSEEEAIGMAIKQFKQETYGYNMSMCVALNIDVVKSD